MDRDYDRIRDSRKAHMSAITTIRQLLTIANINRKEDDFVNLVDTYLQIEEIASSLGESARVLKDL